MCRYVSVPVSLSVSICSVEKWGHFANEEETQLHHKYFVWNKTTLEIVLNAFSNILLFIGECSSNEAWRTECRCAAEACWGKEQHGRAKSSEWFKPVCTLRAFLFSARVKTWGRRERDFTIEFIDWCTFYYLWHLKVRRGSFINKSTLYFGTWAFVSYVCKTNAKRSNKISNKFRNASFSRCKRRFSCSFTNYHNMHWIRSFFNDSAQIETTGRCKSLREINYCLNAIFDPIRWWTDWNDGISAIFSSQARMLSTDNRLLN